MNKSDILQSLHRRLRHGSASPLLLFGLSAAFAGQARAGDAGALPQNPNVAAGSASFAQSGNTLTVNQASNRVVIDWRSFDIGASAQTTFNQPGTGSIAVNRINAGTDPTKIDGKLQANGQVWILNPNGVLFGKTAQVNAAGIVASTANIDTSRFMAGDNRLGFTGKDSGTVANDGHISVGDSGLAAFVAPSVRNSGVITARTGKVALAAGTTFTLDLAGDHLVEIGIGSDKAVVDQAGKIVDPGGTVQLSARAASAVVDGAINMSGVVRTASAHRAGGDIILDGDNVSVSGTADASGTSGGTIAVTGNTIAVSDSASLRADATASGNGGTITATASLRGSYAGRYSARGGAKGGDGGRIETSGTDVTTAPDIAVDASAPAGNAGEWLIDPLNVTISSGSGGGLTGATVTTGAIQAALAGGTGVSITTAQSGSGAGDLTLAGSINATATGNAGLTLTGRHLLETGNSAINIAGGALTLNVNAVNANSTPPTGGWINDALAMIGTVSGGNTINLGAGTYTTSSGYINVNKSNVTLNGAGQGLTILDSRGASTYGLRVTAASNVTLNGFTLYGATAANAYGLKAEATTNLTLTNITSQGAAKSEFDLNGIIGGTLDNLTANGAAATGAGFTSGAPTAGNGISLTDSQNITLTNSITLNNQWGGLALYQSNFPSGYSFQEKNITVATSNTFTEANPIYAEDQSATNDFGALNLAGYTYIVQTAGSPGDVYSWFQKTQQAAVNFAVNEGTGATVQGYAGNGETGNNIFTVGYGTPGGGGSQALSIAAAVSAAVSGATIDILNRVYALATQLDLAKSLTLAGAGTGSTTLTSSSTGYGINVTADNVRLTGFTFNAPTAVGAATYGIKVTPDTNAASDRLLNFAIDHVRINGGYRTGLDLNGVVGATIDTVSVANVVHGNGIALTDSANVTVTNSTTSNNAWGGLALYQTNAFYNQQLNNITVDASNSFNDVIPVYAEKQSATLDFGTIALAGFNYVVQSPNLANDVYSWFQKTAQGAVDFATDAALSNNNINLPTATVQGYAGSGVQGNNIFTVGTGGNGAAMSIGAALTAASSGATVNVLNGTYVVPSGGASYLDITTGLTLTGQSQGGTIIDARNAAAYGLRVQADNVSLGNFTLLGSLVSGGYGVKVEPLNQADANSRINSFSISNVTINGASKNTLDINGAHAVLVDHVTAENAVAGNGIAIVDSSNVTITGSATINNAWGGLRIEEKNATFNQQTDQVTVDASNSFSEAVPVYLEDDSASQNFGAVMVQGFGYIVRAPSNPADVYTWFQATQQGAINYAAGLNLTTATVQGWTGTAGNNRFAVGAGTLAGGATRNLSIQAALDAAQVGATVDVASGSYAESLVQNTRATVNFGTVSLGGSYTLNSGAANSTLSGTLTASAVNWNAPVQLGGALSLNTSGNGSITTAAIDGNQALTLNAGTGTIRLGALGATTALGAVTDLGAVTLTGGTYNAGSFNLGSVTLTADTSLTATSVAASSIDGNHALTVNARSANLGALGAATTLGAVTDLGAVTLTGGTYNANGFNLGNVTLAADTSLMATGALSAVSIDGHHALAISASTSSLGALGATTALGAVTDLGAVTLTGGTYNASGFNLGNVTLAADTSLTAAGMIFVASVDGNYALTINARSANLGVMGATTALGAVTDLGAVTLIGSTYNAGSFNLGSVTLAADTSLTATGMISVASVDGNHALTINASSASLGVLGATTALGAVTDLGAVILAGGTYNASSFNLGSVTLASDTSLSATSTVAASSIDGNHALTIGASTASLGALGATTALGAVTDLVPTTLAGGTYNAAIFTLGNVSLTADTSINATGSVAVSAIDGNHTLTIDAGSASLGTLGATTALAAVTDLAPTTLTGGSYSAASFNLGNVILAADTTINATGAVTVAAIDGNHALSVNASTSSLGALGATTALTAVTDLAPTTLTGGTYSAASFNLGNVILAADTNINATGAVTVAAIDGNHALIINAGSASLGALGTNTALGAVTDLAPTLLTSGTYNATGLDFAGDLTLTAAQTTLDTSSAGGDITVGGNLLGSTNGAQGIVLRAGTGTGPATQNGDILLQNVGTASLALGSMTVMGDNFGAQTVHLAGDFQSTLVGNQVFSSHTLNAGGTVQSAVGGNASGPINAGGSVGLSVSGQLSGAIGGSTISLDAGTIQNAAVTATQAMTITADSVTGSTLAAPSISATANSFSTNVNAGSVNLNAGSITGSTITGSTGITISATTVAGSALAAPTVKATTTGSFSTDVDAASVTLNAGSVSGSTITGTSAIAITAGSVASSSLAAPTVTATADSFSTNINAASVALNAGTVTGSTITGSSDVTVNAKSVQGSSLAAPVVNATADSFDTAVTASSSATITGSDVAGTFSGGSFTVSGSNSVNANVNANSATVSGSAISGTYSGNTIALSGSSSVNATVSSDTLSVQSPSGNLQGSWSTVDTGSSGTLVLNHQASIGDGSVGPAQLVVENFPLPQGVTVTGRGNLMLPQNLVLAAASPLGQGAPSLVVVNSVQQLGDLLSQNYSAIVIDLAGTSKAGTTN